VKINATSQILLATCLLAVFFAKLIASTLKMEAIYSSEASVETQRTTWRHIPEDDTLHNHHCENLKSYTECSSYTPIKIWSRNVTVQYSTCKMWKYSNMVLYETLFNAYRHIYTTKVFGEWQLVLYWGFPNVNIIGNFHSQTSLITKWAWHLVGVCCIYFCSHRWPYFPLLTLISEPHCNIGLSFRIYCELYKMQGF
jgi:hypothetical protein